MFQLLLKEVSNLKKYLISNPEFLKTLIDVKGLYEILETCTIYPIRFNGQWVQSGVGFQHGDNTLINIDMI